MVIAMSGLISAQCLVNAAILVVLKTIENNTGGWGVQLRFFDLPFIRQENPLTQMLVYAAPMALLCFLGVGIGSVYLRWGQLGMWLLLIGTLLTAGATVFAIVLLDLGHDVAAFFSGQPAFALLAVYPAIAGALIGLVSGRVLLRARI
jgi:hypothetical protein